MKIIIYGTQYKAKRLCNHLKKEVEILGFTETECREERILWNGIKCIPLENVLKLDYDYIVVASSAYIEISTYLLSIGVNEERIVQPYNSHFMIPSTLYFYNRIDDSKKLEIFRDFESFCCRRV